MSKDRIEIPTRRVSRRDGFRDVQIMINFLSGKTIAVDGIWGPKSVAAFRAMPKANQSFVLRVAIARGIAPDVILGWDSKDKEQIVPKAKGSIQDKIRRIAKRVGVNESLALTICNMESAFRASATSRTGAIGLFQLTTVAIDDLVARGITTKVPRSQRYDVDWNIWAGVNYIKICAAYAGVSPTSKRKSDWAKVYAAFNIGAGSLSKIKRRKFDDPALVNVVAGQAAILSRAGPRGYLRGAESYINAKLVA